ncbi:MAG: hypothetical protein KGQ46_12370 [Hyphomicrobiales bacterium]|nr:hypothetical protein [Hyphomicrobiales bacterium]MDE2113845.1 helix-turn-helix domain-containing protein [Hyphomicrobiales bacterium]
MSTPIPHRNDHPDYSWLPALLAEIAEVAGLDAALALAEAKGGTRVYFPASAPADHWLPRLVGPEAARLICNHFRATMSGGIGDLVPMGPNATPLRLRAMAQKLTAEGHSADSIARTLKVHQRTVFRMRASGKVRDPRQGNLF